MKTLADIYKTEQLKEKRTKSILIVIIVMLSVTLIYLFSIDPWNIAYEKENKKIKAREDEFAKVLDSKLKSGDYLGAYYIDYDLNLYGKDYELYSLLSDSERLIVHIRNIIEDKTQDNYYDLDYLLDSFYDEYYYTKKYRAPINYVDGIKDEIEEYLLTYNLISSDKLNEIKERNNND